MNWTSFHSRMRKTSLWGAVFAITISVLFVFCIPSHAEMTTQTPEGVSIKVDDRPLVDLISEIQKKTRIQIQVPGSMQDEKLTARIEAKDWREAVSQLLQDFNHIKLSGSENGKDKFLLLGGRRVGGPIEFKSASLPKASSGNKPAKKIDPVLARQKLKNYKEQVKKRREERIRKTQEMKEYERLTGSPHPSSTLSGSGSKPHTSSTTHARKSQSVPNKMPAGGYPDPALVQQKLKQYRANMRQKQQGQ